MKRANLEVSATQILLSCKIIKIVVFFYRADVLDRVATSKRKYVASSSSSISSRRRKNKRRNTVRKSRHQGDGNAVLRVDKLAFGTTFEQLRSRFEPFGTVKDVSVHFYEKRYNQSHFLV